MCVPPSECATHHAPCASPSCLPLQVEFNKAALSLADAFPADQKKAALNRLLKVGGRVGGWEGGWVGGWLAPGPGYAVWWCDP